MKRRSGKRMAPEFSRGEHIRVVPLHHPKPATPMAGPSPVTTTAHLTYRGGPLLQNAEVFTIFWGTTWGATPSATATMEKLNRFFADILASPVVDQLAEYNVPGQTIGHGSLIGTRAIPAASPAKVVTDSMLQSELGKWLKAGLVPKQTKNSLYFVYLEPGVVSVMGGGRSCQSYCGYHSSAGPTYYALMPYPGCDGCLGGLAAFDALTGTSSHELCEAITDPVPGSGWYDDANGEIGDICAWKFKQVAGYTVQLEWSNRENRCV